jgi:hypothetical protein
LDFPKLKKKNLQIKSIISLPSQYLPAGMSKYVSPLGKLGGGGGERSCQSTGIGVGVTKVKDCWELTVFEIKDGGGSCKRHGKGEKSYKIDCSSRNKFHAGSEN